MGSCFSKKNCSSPPTNAADYVAISSAPAPAAPPVANPKFKTSVSVPAKQEQEESKVKKEIFIIKHRKSHDDRDRPLPLQQEADGVAASAPVATAATTESCDQASIDDKKPAEASAGTGVRVRTSSCNKEEVDAILIQCGRLSRSSSGKAASSSSASCDRSKKYSGSKRSYDFDNCENDYQVAATSEDVSDEKTLHHRQRHRQSSRHSPSPGRRRTPSKERNQQQRSSSRERERRTSRSPGRRLSLEQNNPNCNANTTTSATANVNSDTTATNRPGKMKMVSVPATVMDKNSNGESATTGSIKRISVKRNAGEAVNVVVGSRTAASPRSQSPARGGGNAKASIGSLPPQQPSLSRSSSRKAEKSPYRRNPLSELDPNSLAYPQSQINNTINKSDCNVVNPLKPNYEINKIVAEGINHRSSTASSSMDKKVVEPTEASGVDCLKHQTLTRSRSSRRSRDLDINPETFSNPPPSYTRLLLADIQNFHQQSSNAAAVSLPQCVSKACSIVEAVADLNSTTNFSSDRKSPSIDQINQTSCYYNCSLNADLVQRKDSPFVESEVLAEDDLMQPSFHKYVTVKRGGADMEDQESSGSNSFVSGSQQPSQWGSSSSWEPNSVDSTDCWTSKSSTKEDDQSFDKDEAARRRLSRRKTDGHNTQCSGGIGRSKLVATKGPHVMPVVAAAAST